MQYITVFLTKFSFVIFRTFTFERLYWIPDHCSTILTFVNFFAFRLKKTNCVSRRQHAREQYGVGGRQDQQPNICVAGGEGGGEVSLKDLVAHQNTRGIEMNSN